MSYPPRFVEMVQEKDMTNYILIKKVPHFRVNPMKETLSLKIKVLVNMLLQFILHVTLH